MLNKLTIAGILAIIFFIAYTFVNQILLNNNYETIQFSWESIGLTYPSGTSICGDYVPEAAPSWDEFVSSTPLRPSGVAISILENAGTPVGAYTYALSPEQEITPSFHMWYPETSQNVTTLNVRLIAILDERQLSNVFTSIDIELHSFSQFSDFQLEPGSNIEIQFNLPSLSNGVHDLIVLALYNVEDEPNDRGHIANTAMRFTLIVGSGEVEIIRTYDLAPTIYHMTGEGSSIPLILSLSNRELSTWNWPNTTLPLTINQDELEFYTWLGNSVITRILPDGTEVIPTPHDQPVALLTLLDYQQENNYITDAIQYLMISKDSEFSLTENTINLPAEEGRYDIVSLRINYPGTPMCLLYGDQDGMRFYHNVDLQRVSITMN